MSDFNLSQSLENLRNFVQSKVGDLVAIDDAMLRTDGVGNEVMEIRRFDQQATELSGGVDEVYQEPVRPIYAGDESSFLQPVTVIGHCHEIGEPEERAKYGTELQIDFLAVFSVLELDRKGLIVDEHLVPEEERQAYPRLDGASGAPGSPGRYILIQGGDEIHHGGDIFFVQRVRPAHKRGSHIFRVQVLGRKAVAGKYTRSQARSVGSGSS